MIMDEVVTGFRVHPGGCQALFGIRGDLATYGKVCAGGMPIGILAGKAQFMDALDGGAWRFGDDSFPEVGVTFFAGTFVRHPLALAAVKAVLIHFKEQGPALQQRAQPATAGMVLRLNALFEQNNVPSRVEHFRKRLLFQLPVGKSASASLFYYYLRVKGIHVLEGFPCFLTTTHSEADIAKIVAAFKESVIEMQNAGFFPQLSRERRRSSSDSRQHTTSDSRHTRHQNPNWKSGSPTNWAKKPHAATTSLSLLRMPRKISTEPVLKESGSRQLVAPA